MDWQTLRNQTIERFGGDTPQPPLEHRLTNIFETNPQLVTRTIDKIAGAYDTGRIRSPWAVLITDLEGSITATHNVTANPGPDREKRIQRAEQWIRNAGAHFDRESELLDELFNDRGLLADYTTDQHLRTRLTELWHNHRPRIIQVDHDYKLEQAAQRAAHACPKCGSSSIGSRGCRKCQYDTIHATRKETPTANQPPVNDGIPF